MGVYVWTPYHSWTISILTTTRLAFNQMKNVVILQAISHRIGSVHREFVLYI